MEYGLGLNNNNPNSEKRERERERTINNDLLWNSKQNKSTQTENIIWEIKVTNHS